MRYASIVLLICVLLSGCGNNATNAQDEPLDIVVHVDQDDTTDTGDQDDESAAAGDPGIEDATILIGTWQDVPSIGSMDRQRYHFFEDGNYIFEYSQYDLETRLLSEIGVWSLENSFLNLIIFEKVTIEGGEKSTEPLLPGDEFNEFAIINGTIRIIELDPPVKEEHKLSDFFQDNENSPGYWTMMISKTRYWKYSDSPDTYLNEPFQDGDVFRPWP